eukprot:88295-Prorocentrum_minimum.AAC.5
MDDRTPPSPSPVSKSTCYGTRGYAADVASSGPAAAALRTSYAKAARAASAGTNTRRLSPPPPLLPLLPILRTGPEDEVRPERSTRPTP